MLTYNMGKEDEIRELIDRMMLKVNTCIPGVIQSFDPARQTVSVVPAIKMRTMIDGVEGFLDLPKIVEVPIVFPSSSVKGFAVTLPISIGDSCLLIFSQRAIDNWHDLGGIQPPEAGVGSRHHDLTDAFAILSPMAVPDMFENWEPNGIEIRNREKNSRVTVRDTEIEIQKGDNSLVTVNDDKIEVKYGDIILTVDSTGAKLEGNLLVTGSIVSQTSVADPKGTMQEMRDFYNEHKHVETGSSTQKVIAPYIME